MKNFIILFLAIGLFSCSNSSSPSADVVKAETPVKEVEPENYTKISWQKMDNIEALAAKNPKKILVDVYTDWCGPCKMMDKNTFTDNSIIQQVSKNFHAVKWNAERAESINFQGKEYANPGYKPNVRGRNAVHQLSSFFQVPGYPTLVVMDENMKILGQIVGYKQPDQLSAELARFFN